LTGYPKAGRVIAALALLLISLNPAIAAAKTPVKDDSAKFMPVSQVKRGMRGHGLTVFAGTKIEKFDVEILGVIKQTNTGKDLILVRIGGGPITSRKAGVIAGMSGSPCYIDGKMIGAIAYGAQFASEPVGMITPIADMLEAWDESLPKQASGHSSPSSLPEPVNVDGATMRRLMPDSHIGDDGALTMQPLAMPLMVSGLSARGLNRLGEVLRPFGVQPMAGPGGGVKDNVKADLVPGAAVGVSLASGDIDITGVGTLTYRRGNKVVGFGHPMLGIGAIDAPMTTAYVHDVISSYRTSTKLASPIETVGRVFQDRPWSIAGAMGVMPKTIPVKIDVDDRSFGRQRTYRARVINHPLLASQLITVIAGEAIYNTHPTPGDVTAEVTYEVNADQIGRITRSNVFFDPISIDMAATSDIGTLLQILSANRFYPLDIKSVGVKIRIEDRRNTASIDRIFVKKTEYEPGETVEVGVVMRPYKKERVTKTYKVKIPATAADGKLILQVRGGGVSGSPMEMPVQPDDSGESAPPMMMDPGAATADNVKQLVDKYLERPRNNEVVVELLLKGTAVNVAGEKLTGLPSAIADVMKSSRNSGLKTEREQVKETCKEEMIVRGAARLVLTVKQKVLKDGPSPPRIAPGPPEPLDEPSSGSIDVPSDDGDPAYLSAVASLRPAADEPSVTVEDDIIEDEALGEPPMREGAPNATPAPADSAKPESPGVKSDVKTVVRQAQIWSQRLQSEFAKGRFSGVSASSKNKLELAPTVKKLAETPEQFAWCIAPARDGVYSGTGDAGKIYHISDSGEAKVFFQTGELEVHALAADKEGNLYAGTSPRGKVFKITPDGKGSVLFTTDEKYVLAIALDGEGNVYAGVGDAGKVYQHSQTGLTRVFAEINEQQVLSLYRDPKGGLLAGTGINGVLYRIDSFGKATPIFDASEDSLTAVVTDNDGTIYAGTSPAGSVYKISPEGRSEKVYSKAARVLSMTKDPEGNVYAVSDGSLVKITPKGTVMSLDSSQDKVQFLSLAYNESTGALYASTGNIGAVYVSRCCDVVGTYESSVHDTRAVSKWGRIKWMAEVPAGTSVEVRTRTGNVVTPDATWTDWSSVYANSDGEPIAGADARYIQYRLTLKTNSLESSPKVSMVSLSYLTPNQAPKVTVQAPSGGEVWAGSKTIKWAGVDPDKDTLSYDVYYSKDSGEWVALQGGAAKDDAKKPDEAKITAKVRSELEKSPDVPEDMKAEVLKDSEPSAKPGDRPGATPPSSKSSYAWDTKKVEDGRYVIKIVASDRPSNASGALSNEAISQPITVCNSAPDVVLYQGGVQLKAVGAATVNGSARSKAVEVVGVQYRVDEGEWLAATAQDGVFDSPYEVFAIETGKLNQGKHKVEVQAVDAAGNASSKSLEVVVSS